MIEKLVEMFSKFPGIGQRQAKRFVFFLLSEDYNFIKNLTGEISALKNSIKNCQSCFRFYFEKKSGGNICSICENSERSGTLMVLSTDIDLENIEKAGAFGGKYFVLGGTVPILEKSPRQKIRIDKLISQVETLAEKEKLEEIILAMDFNPEGENTTLFVKKELSPLQEKYKFGISSLGKGLSLGTELEYCDPETIKNAFKNRV